MILFILPVINIITIAIITNLSKLKPKTLNKEESKSKIIVIGIYTVTLSMYYQVLIVINIVTAIIIIYHKTNKKQQQK